MCWDCYTTNQYHLFWYSSAKFRFIFYCEELNAPPKNECNFATGNPFWFLVIGISDLIYYSEMTVAAFVQTS